MIDGSGFQVNHRKLRRLTVLDRLTARAFRRGPVLAVACSAWLATYTNYLPRFHLAERVLESRYQWLEHFNLVAVRDQRDDAQPQAGEILLLLEAPIDRNEHIKSCRSQS